MKNCLIIKRICWGFKIIVAVLDHKINRNQTKEAATFMCKELQTMFILIFENI